MLKTFIFILTLFSASLYSQTKEIDSLKTILTNTDSDEELATINLQLAKLYELIDINKGKEYANKAFQFQENDSLLAETNNQLARFHFFSGELDSASIYFEKTKYILNLLDDNKGVASVNISLGAIQLRQGDYNKTIKTLTQSATFFEENNDPLKAAKCYSNMASAFAELENFPKAIEYSEKALVIFYEQKQIQYQLITLPNLATQYFKNGDTIKAINHYNKAEELAIKLDNKRSLSMTYNNLGNIYLDNQPQLAKDYLEKAIALKNDLNIKTGIGVAQSNLGYIHLNKKEFQTSIKYFNLAINDLKGKQLVSVYNYLTESYKGINKISKALEYSEKSRTLNDSILNSENRKNFNEIVTKFETEKKEKEILQLKTENLIVDNKRKQNQNLLIATLLVLAIALFLVYFLLKNAKRKRIIMQQENIINNQEFDKKLKSQELNAIDAIIEAQEKERTRIANDLHDNLGSKIATLKLYIEDIEETINAQNKKETALINKLKVITDDTYKEIRKIAHNKNFGLLINKGLIHSTKTIAKQISNSNKLDIKVINVDVNKALENHIEIQIFRSIQEILTNCIKHSKANEIIIQFSEDDNILNIIIEDNGIGFNINKTKFGHGLTNIEKRMEKIQGEVTFDSTIGYGTTIILNIPL